MLTPQQIGKLSVMAGKAYIRITSYSDYLHATGQSINGVHPDYSELNVYDLEALELEHVMWLCRRLGDNIRYPVPSN